MGLLDRLRPQQQQRSGPLYERSADSFDLYVPSQDEIYGVFLKPDGVVPVVVDPQLSQHLLKKQKEGVRFLWDNYIASKGCILAHEVGLGKTFTCITLIKTLLEQSVGARGVSAPSIGKVIIVAPKPLVSVWMEEFYKWAHSIKRVRTWSKPKEDEKIIRDFCADETVNVLVTSYEVIQKFRRYFMADYGSVTIDGFHEEEDAEVEEDDESEDADTSLVGEGGGCCITPVPLLICDEVHRLKNRTAKVTLALNRIPASIRIGVTGTPVQNNLEEFCNLIHFVQPGVLYEKIGISENDFREEYLTPFSAYQMQKKNSVLTDEDQRKLGEIKRIVEPILQLQIGDVNVVKHDVILCSKFTDSQRIMYRLATGFLDQKEEGGRASRGGGGGKGNQNFWYLANRVLRNVCLHPSLVPPLIHKHKWPPEISAPYERASMIREGLLPYFAMKVQLVIATLAAIKLQQATKRTATATPDSPSASTSSLQAPDPHDRVVIVSYSTSLLDLVQQALDLRSYKHCRFDGQTKDKLREEIRHAFNDPKEDMFVFLLSSKAGGAGISLTAANHLFILDPDWNPANDEQAMGRIWREGQMKECFIYRLLYTGSIEEIMFNRQLSKRELKSYLTIKDHHKLNVLKEADRALFKFCDTNTSTIHDLMACTKCTTGGGSGSDGQQAQEQTLSGSGGGGEPDLLEATEYGVTALAKWNHYSRPADVAPRDLPVLFKLWNDPQNPLKISFVFHKKTAPADRVHDVGEALLRTVGANPNPSTTPRLGN